jgi:hypothetical protein
MKSQFEPTILAAAVISKPAIILWWYLWIAPNVLCAVALVLAVRRKCFNTLPWFVILLGYCTLKFAVYVSIRSSLAYDRLGVLDLLVSTPLELAVIYELANKLTLSHSSLAGRLAPLPRWIAAGLLLAATVATALFTSPMRDQLLRTQATLSFFNDSIELSLILVVLLIARIVGVSLRSLPAGVLLGMGITDGGGMAGIVMQGRIEGAFATDIIRGCSWHLGVLVWLFYLLTPEKPADSSESARQISKLEPHSRELQRFFQR